MSEPKGQLLCIVSFKLLLLLVQRIIRREYCLNPEFTKNPKRSIARVEYDWDRINNSLKTTWLVLWGLVKGHKKITVTDRNQKNTKIHRIRRFLLTVNNTLQSEANSKLWVILDIKDWPLALAQAFNTKFSNIHSSHMTYPLYVDLDIYARGTNC